MQRLKACLPTENAALLPCLRTRPRCCCRKAGLRVRLRAQSSCDMDAFDPTSPEQKELAALEAQTTKLERTAAAAGYFSARGPNSWGTRCALYCPIHSSQTPSSSDRPLRRTRPCPRTRPRTLSTRTQCWVSTRWWTGWCAAPAPSLPPSVLTRMGLLSQAPLASRLSSGLPHVPHTAVERGSPRGGARRQDLLAQDSQAPAGERGRGGGRRRGQGACPAGPDPPSSHNAAELLP